MINKLPFLDRMNSNTPSRETSANRDKLNELVDEVNKIVTTLENPMVNPWGILIDTLKKEEDKTND